MFDLDLDCCLYLLKCWFMVSSCCTGGIDMLLGSFELWFAWGWYSVGLSVYEFGFICLNVIDFVVCSRLNCVLWVGIWVDCFGCYFCCY